MIIMIMWVSTFIEERKTDFAAKDLYFTSKFEEISRAGTEHQNKSAKSQKQEHQIPPPSPNVEWGMARLRKVK